MDREIVDIRSNTSATLATIPSTTPFNTINRAPLSKNQEVSAFGNDGAGDDMDVWTVVCNYGTWRRDSHVKLKHKGTTKYLGISGQQYNRPIHGQMEVVAQSNAGGGTDWSAAEGVFVSPQGPTSHDEL